jgi:medium-chain acyl-[acyl-carrier-protein] hydrolase
MLTQRLRRLGGMPEALLADQELLEYFTPILRADFQVNEAYEYAPEPPLACPISAFYGSQDELMTYDDVLGWREQTTHPFRLHALREGHFYITNARSAFWDILAHDLQQILAGLPGTG